MMVRNYKRKTEDKWSKQDLLEALTLIKDKKCKINDAVRQFGISRATLYRQNNKFKEGNWDMNQFRTCGGNPILNKVEEDVLEKTILDLREQGFSVTSSDIKRICFEYCDSNGIPNQFNKEKRMASDDWYYGFLRRHANIRNYSASSDEEDGGGGGKAKKRKVIRKKVKSESNGTSSTTISKKRVKKRKKEEEDDEEGHDDDESEDFVPNKSALSSSRRKRKLKAAKKVGRSVKESKKKLKIDEVVVKKEVDEDDVEEAETLDQTETNLQANEAKDSEDSEEDVQGTEHVELKNLFETELEGNDEDDNEEVEEGNDDEEADEENDEAEEDEQADEEDEADQNDEEEGKAQTNTDGKVTTVVGGQFEDDFDIELHTLNKEDYM